MVDGGAIIPFNEDAARTTWKGREDVNITRRKRIYDEARVCELHECKIGDWDQGLVIPGLESLD